MQTIGRGSRGFKKKKEEKVFLFYIFERLNDERSMMNQNRHIARWK